MSCRHVDVKRTLVSGTPGETGRASGFEELRRIDERCHFGFTRSSATTVASHNGRGCVLVVHGEGGQRAEEGDPRGHEEPNVVRVQVGHDAAIDRVNRVQERDDGGQDRDSNGRSQLALSVENRRRVTGLDSRGSSRTLRLGRAGILRTSPPRGRTRPAEPARGWFPRRLVPGATSFPAMITRPTTMTRRGPSAGYTKRVTSWAPVITPNASGKMLSPACKAFSPNASWKKRASR